ncbi:HK97 gp10 family phage protein [Mannheimia haemolytica]|uniref:HK97 gp10 family phage protein n=1 Tax=Mannheimia haemolytica TaxID=75985 RepID=UPI000B25A31E|nr:HK97 gp10 family phage protein [Mannheimia haemolytica]
MGSFHAQIARFVEQTQQKADRALRVIALQTLSGVQKKSPVDTGQLRRSWTVALNGFPSSYNGSQTVLNSAKFGDMIVIATNKPYAPMLEYGLYPNPPKNRPARPKTVIQYKHLMEWCELPCRKCKPLSAIIHN